MADQLPAAPAAPQPTLDEAFSTLVEMAKNPAVDAGKIAALVNLQTSMIDRQRADAFNAAFMAAKGEMPTIRKDGALVHPGRNGAPDKLIARYARWESIQRVVRPILKKHGLDVSFDGTNPEAMDGKTVFISVVVRHQDGHVERFRPIPFGYDAGGSKSGAQASASALSLGKRHAFAAAFDLVIDGEDDDGDLGRAMKAAADIVSAKLPEAENAARQGDRAYAEFFARLDTRTKAAMSASGVHDRLKQIASRANTATSAKG